LAFPLLKALTDAGDPQARQIFAEEIAKRFDSEYLPVMTYLIVNGYLSYLTPQQIKSLNFIEKMINPDLKGRNQGAESTLAWLLSLLNMYYLDTLLEVDIITKESE